MASKLNFFPLDMVASVKPDERAVMTYVSCYYHAFSSSQAVRYPHYNHIALLLHTPITIYF